MERSAYFALMNHSKRSAAFDVDADRERLDALLAADRRRDREPRPQAGHGARTSPRRSRPPTTRDLLAVSSSGFGQDGPHADYRAYAYNLQASVRARLPHPQRTTGESAEIDIAWADLIAAYSLATIIAAWAVGPAGNAGAGLDFAMADLVVAHFNEFIAAASLDPDADAGFDRANELAPYAPVRRVPDRSTAGSPWRSRATSSVPGWSRWSATGRWTTPSRGPMAQEELAAALRAVGVPAERALGADDLVADAQLAARGFFTTVEHDDWGRRSPGRASVAGVRRAALALGPPPRFAPMEGTAT